MSRTPEPAPLADTSAPKSPADTSAAGDRHRVVIVGGGFGGLCAARALGRERRVTVTLIDRQNFHLFQPLLYQVATGALAPSDIAQPLRSVLRRQSNTTVLLGEARDLDAQGQEVRLSDGGVIPYDTLVVATGARFSYFGHEDWAPDALRQAGAALPLP